MGQWFYTLDIKEIHHKAQERLINPGEWAKAVAQEIKLQLPSLYVNDADLEQIVYGLEDIQDEYEVSWDDIDNILDDLYNWADYIRCWVKTF